MMSLIFRRLLIGLLTLWIVSIIIFAGTEVLPGDIAEAILGQSATEESVAALREQMGLNRSAPERYFSWLFGLFQGDLGVSLASDVPIADIIWPRLQNTLMLAGVTALFAVPLALTVGITAAMFPGSVFDRAATISTLMMISVPEFFLAAFLVLIFSVHLQWLPAIAYVTEFESFGQLLSSLAMPIMVMTAVVVSQMARMTRAAILNVLSSPYIEMAILKGVPRRRIIMRHALLNAIGPIVNVVALNLAYLVSGVVIVETMFAFPGLAKMMVDAVSVRDVPLVQACAILFCSAYIVLNLIADIVAVASNPRLRHPR